MKKINNGLIDAAKTGDEVSLKSLLVQPSFNPLTKDVGGMTALMHAARSGHTSCAQLQLPTSDALAKNGEGWTALMYAALHGHSSCTELLIPVSDVLTKDNNYSRTALMWAAWNGHTLSTRQL